MSKSVLKGTLTQAGVAAKFFVLAALLFWWALQSSYAAQASSQFAVDIYLQPGGNTPNAGICRNSSRIGTFGEAVTIDCSTGRTGNTSQLPWSAAQDGYYRYIIRHSIADGAASNQFAGAGTVTSWRIVNLSDWEYLELMIGW